MSLPFSQACENNKQAIFEVLKQYLESQQGDLLEIGTCTAQHVVYFAEKLKNINWQTSDQAEFLDGINARLKQEGGNNIYQPIELDVTKHWPDKIFDFAFTANTCHIMAKESVEDFFRGLAGCLKQQGLFFIYGPFKYKGQFTTPSNERFNQWLNEQNDYSGIRDFEYLLALAEKYGYEFLHDHQMPANNQLLVFRKN